MTDKPTVYVLSGPNLNLLGTREPEIYGHDTLNDIHARLEAQADGLGLRLECRQTNHEGEYVGFLHQALGTADGLIVNPGAWTHSSWAIHDALAAFDGVVVEVHISNPNAREPWRHTSVVAPVATGSIMGFGKHGYDLAIQAVAAKLGL